MLTGMTAGAEDIFRVMSKSIPAKRPAEAEDIAQIIYLWVSVLVGSHEVLLLTDRKTTHTGFSHPPAPLSMESMSL